MFSIDTDNAIILRKISAKNVETESEFLVELNYQFYRETHECINMKMGREM